MQIYMTLYKQALGRCKGAVDNLLPLAGIVCCIPPWDHRLTEYVEWEKTHKDHQVQLLALHPKNHSPKSIV